MMCFVGKKGMLPGTNLIVDTQMDILRHIYKHLYEYKNGVSFIAYVSDEDCMYNVTYTGYSIFINKR
jgi:hypothetical protein